MVAVCLGCFPISQNLVKMSFSVEVSGSDGSYAQ